MTKRKPLSRADLAEVRATIWYDADRAFASWPSARGFGAIVKRAEKAGLRDLAEAVQAAEAAEDAADKAYNRLSRLLDKKAPR